MPCMEKPGQCYKQNVYKMVCEECKSQGQVVEYYGESARSAFDRGAEHHQSLEAKDRSNPLVTYWQECHSDSDWRFSMRVIRSFKSPLQRQSCEGYLIANLKVTY